MSGMKGKLCDEAAAEDEEAQREAKSRADKANVSNDETVSRRQNKLRRKR